MNGIRSQVLQFAEDEGRQSALDKLERWRDVLEEMMEVCEQGLESRACSFLLTEVRATITRLLESPKTTT